MNRYFFLVFFLFFIVGCSINNTKHYIYDNAALLKRETIKTLNSSIAYKTKMQSVQLFVITITGINKIETIDKYTEGLISKKDFGRLGFDRTFVFVIYAKENAFRLRWGNFLSKRINSEDIDKIVAKIEQLLKDGDVEGSVRYCIDTIYSLIKN